MYERILSQQVKETTDYSPASVLKMLKFVCEERNAALQNADREKAKYRLRDSYYERDVVADMKGFMRAIKRKLGVSLESTTGGSLPPGYEGCLLYYKQQRAIIKGLRGYTKRSVSPTRAAGKTAYNLAGRYYGNGWVLSCFDAAMKFNKTTSATVLWSYFW